MAENPFARDPYVFEQTKDKKVNPFLEQGQVLQGAGSTLGNTLKDAAWQGYAGVNEGALKAPGALFGDLPLYAIDKLTRAGDFFGRLSAGAMGGKKGYDDYKPSAYDVNYKDNPLGSNSVRTMERELLGFGDPGEPQTGLGRTARTAGEFMGGAAVTGPMTLGNMGRAALGGVGSKLAGDAFPDSEIAPVVGAIAGSSLPGVAGSLATAAVPNMTPRMASDVRELRSRGVPVFPGQAAQNPAVNNVWDMSRNLSVFDNGSKIQQDKAFTRAASRTMGANSEDITQGVLDGTQRRLAARLNRIYGQTTVPQGDAPLLRDLARIEADATRALQPQQVAYVQRALDEVRGAFANGDANGADVWNMFKRGSVSALNNAQQSADPVISTLARDIKNSLVDTLERNAPQGFRDALRETNQQYANYSTLKKMPQLSGTDDVSPGSMLNTVVNKQGGVRGSIGRLAKAGKNALKPVRSSGTAERAMVMSMLGAGGAGTVAGLLNPLAMGGVAAAAAAPMGMRGLLESQWLMDAMLRKAAGRNNALGRVRMNALAPGAPTAINAAAQGVSTMQPRFVSGGLLGP